MIDDMQLRNIRCEALYLGATLIKAQQGEYAFMDLGAIINTAARQNHSDFLVHVFVLQERVRALDMLPATYRVHEVWVSGHTAQQTVEARRWAEAFAEHSRMSSHATAFAA
jgi:hypothetical protein